MTFSRVRVVVIGGGPAGIAAAIAAASDGASVVLVERGKRLGGMLLQSIHAGFGLERFDEAVSGPEYAYRDISMLKKTNVIVMLQTTIDSISSVGNAFQLNLSNRHGVAVIESNAIVLATGCRERTLSEMGIFGNNPAGVFTAGTCQHYLNINGQLPTRRCLVLGTDNLALVTAQNLSQSGAKVLGVYEPGSSPKGYLDYVTHCLFDNSIELFFSHTVTRIFGSGRLRGVELSRVDANQNPIRGTTTIVQCDGLIYSGGLLPINELALSLGLPISNKTLAPVCDQHSMTLVDGIFACGNGAYISDVVDYVSETGRNAGHFAATHLERTRQLVAIESDSDTLTYFPQCIDYDLLYGETALFFDVSRRMQNAKLRVSVDGNEIFSQEYEFLHPHQTRRIEVDFAAALTPESKVAIGIK